MSIAINKCTYGGRLTRDPEIRSITGDRQVASFSLAINRRWTDSAGNRREATTYIDAEAWGQLATTLQRYVKKGDQLIIEGRTDVDDYESADGIKRRRSKCTCTAIHLLPQGQPSQQGGQS